MSELNRILEPEAMDTPEEAADYDAMDHAEVNRRFVDDLLAAGNVQGDVLDLGTGTARIPIELCQRVASCRVMAVDVAVEMLELARYNVEVANIRERLMLDHVDGKKLPYRDHSFAIVMSNSIVHHIPEPPAVLREAVRVTAPGGRLFFRDLLRPDSADQLAALVEQYAGEEAEHAREMFRASLHAALTLGEIREMVAQLGFDRETVQQTSDRHWTWAAKVPAAENEDSQRGR